VLGAKIVSTRLGYFLSHDIGKVAGFEEQLKPNCNNITPYKTISAHPIE